MEWFCRSLGPPCITAQRLPRYTCSQGGVKFPTGGIWVKSQEPTSAFRKEGSSRAGETPAPTVIVRMKENVALLPPNHGRVRRGVFALGDVSDVGKGEYT